MADKYLNYTGLGYFYNRLKTLFAAVDDIPTKLSELENDGDGTQGSAYATEDYVDQNGGKIDTIKVNNSALPISNKEVNIDLTTYALKTELPTKVSDLTNDSGYQTESEVQALIDEELADFTSIDFQVVDSLPATGTKGVIYLVSNGGSQSDIYDEYIWVEPTGQTARYEKIGTTAVDLSGYWSKTELVAITTAEIDAIVEA